MTPTIRGTQSLERAIIVLELLCRAGGKGMRLSDVASAAALNISTAHRILNAFESHGWIEKEHATKCYRLGIGLFSVGAWAADGMGLRRICRPALRQIAEETEETVFLMVRSIDDMVCVDRQEGEYVVTTPMQFVGASHPIGVGVAGVAILASMRQAEVELIIERNSDKYKQFNIDIDIVRRRISHARFKGYAMRDGEEIRGLSAVAMAIRPYGRDVVAAISINLMSARLTAQRLPQLVRILERECAHVQEQLSVRSNYNV